MHQALEQARSSRKWGSNRGNSLAGSGTRRNRSQSGSTANSNGWTGGGRQRMATLIATARTSQPVPAESSTSTEASTAEARHQAEHRPRPTVTHVEEPGRHGQPAEQAPHVALQPAARDLQEETGIFKSVLHEAQHRLIQQVAGILFEHKKELGETFDKNNEMPQRRRYRNPAVETSCSSSSSLDDEDDGVKADTEELAEPVWRTARGRREDDGDDDNDNDEDESDEEDVLPSMELEA
ncbi:hypothetical protein N657DRAFT_633464 [Parathielavia appendiculata]|uniref:Uncharacterized protein n=1 Tax=Parathielavia appendiculata TaxID=2587402 RepID=A0AAN6U0U5_9PEZI|nr:hypothetical protein N657DRAFT_633464 [Parathielavia appendiculata]